jgi:hypothetical protein
MIGVTSCIVNKSLTYIITVTVRDCIMGKAWRIEYEDALYHILSRGNERHFL